MDIERQILEPIDRVLSEVRIPDEIRTIEDDVWREIDESYKAGWIETADEAQEMFFNWRAKYLGHTAISVKKC